MKKIILCFVVGVFFSVLVPHAFANTEAEQAAVASAETWLTLLDQEQYDQSYTESAAFFKQSITKDDWMTTISQIRQALDDMTSRELVRQQYTDSLPNAPEGEYVVIQFETTFGDETQVIETITPMLEDDGSWRVSGYYIQ